MHNKTNLVGGYSELFFSLEFFVNEKNSWTDKKKARAKKETAPLSRGEKGEAKAPSDRWHGIRI